MEPEREEASLPDARTLAEGQAVLLAGSRCLSRLANGLDDSFVHAVEAILKCEGMLVTTGIGKAGHIAIKTSATFASTGTPSFYLHPTEAIHGDLGRVRKRDVVLMYSNSGSSAELTRLVPPLKLIGATIISITGNRDSVLGQEPDIVLCFGKHAEAGHLGLAPTTSTTAMLGLGDALAMAVLSRRDFTPREFARYHPGGSLGRSLTRVSEVMRQGEANPVTEEDRPVLEVLHLMSTTKGRPGAASIVDANGKLTGFYTDGDFRRQMEFAFEAGDERFLKLPIRDAMTERPLSIEPDRLVTEATRIMRERKVDQLPVVDGDGRPIGLIDVQDLLDVRLLG